MQASNINILVCSISRISLRVVINNHNLFQGSGTRQNPTGDPLNGSITLPHYKLCKLVHVIE